MTSFDSNGYIRSLEARGWQPGLERMFAACGELGDPQKSFDSMLVAGTNGKGSTSAVLEALLGFHGIKTGLYTSPSLEKVNERISVAGRDINDSDLESLTAGLVHVSEKHKLTQFEFLTLAAFAWFKKTGVEVGVLEVGMGGRLDAVNVVEPIVSVITPIGIDHVAFLGSDLRSIAIEKAGVMREGVVTILALQEPKVFKAFEERALDIGSKLVCEDKDFSSTRKGHEHIFGPEIFSYRSDELSLDDLRLNLLGPHQVSNASCAIAAFVKTACKTGFEIEEGLVRRSLEQVRWPGRFEVIRLDPPVVLDGAHNPHGVASLIETLRERVGGSPVHLVFGVLGDKDWRSMVPMLAGSVSDVQVAPPSSPRAADPEVIASAFLENGVAASASKNVSEALEKAVALARKDSGVVVVCGSLYMLGEVISHERSQA